MAISCEICEVQSEKSLIAYLLVVMTNMVMSSRKTAMCYKCLGKIHEAKNGEMSHKAVAEVIGYCSRYCGNIIMIQKDG